MVLHVSVAVVSFSSGVSCSTSSCIDRVRGPGAVPEVSIRFVWGWGSAVVVVVGGRLEPPRGTAAMVLPDKQDTGGGFMEDVEEVRVAVLCGVLINAPSLPCGELSS